MHGSRLKGRRTDNQKKKNPLGRHGGKEKKAHIDIKKCICTEKKAKMGKRLKRAGPAISPGEK